ncbi:hypothetical protein QAD02_003530 [Eretmocerus hayati]|uniref:Uncharacterized protein n=1 Tax=Eretmocerus hayati TaxID=131215 RepID=A0ACC2NMY5_9HYME|nr:hypothetical protein QAD02_003530 [Eretmocerus hayati]
MSISSLITFGSGCRQSLSCEVNTGSWCSTQNPEVPIFYRTRIYRAPDAIWCNQCLPTQTLKGHIVTAISDFHHYTAWEDLTKCGGCGVFCLFQKPATSCIQCYTLIEHLTAQLKSYQGFATSVFNPLFQCEKQSPQVKAYYTLRFAGFGFDLCDQCFTQTSEDTQLDVVRITDEHRLGVEFQPAFCRSCYIACTLVRSGYDCEHCSLKLLLNFSTETPSDDFAQSQHCNSSDGPYKTETRVFQILSAAKRKSDPIPPFSKDPSKHTGSP